MAAGSDDRSGLTAAQTRSSSDQRSVLILENRIDSRDLFGVAKEVTIAHSGEVYRLRLTSQNKLILTK